jgi:membrane protein CcdC involved in cytochrome C biogenesis
MQAHDVQPNGLTSYIVPVVIILVVFALRMRRMSQLRPLKLERLWIVPSLYLLVVIGLFVEHPPTLGGWAIALAALAAGCALGWQRGRMMQIHVDPETHALNQKASVAGMAFLVGLILVRMVARSLGGDLHMDVNVAVEALAALALGMFSLQRLEMYLRARRLLDQARAGRAA